MVHGQSLLQQDSPWNVLESKYPADGSAEEKLKFLVHYGVMAPSRYNSQPWLFRVTGNELLMYADRSRSLPEVDPDDRELTISCGASLHHVVVAMRHFGHEPIVHTFPAVSDPDCLASVQMGAPYTPTREDGLMFAALTRRRTNREPFKSVLPSDAELDDITDKGGGKGVQYHRFTSKEERCKIIHLIRTADAIKREDASYRKELLLWKYAHGNRRLHGVTDEAQKDSRSTDILQGTPLFLVLSSDVDTPASWLLTGQALSRVLLRAAIFGVSASFLNQPIVVDDVRKRLSRLVAERYPQVLLRMGYGTPMSAPERRPIHEVIVSGPPRNVSSGNDGSH